MLFQINLDIMEEKNIPFECLLGKYIANLGHDNVMHVDKINLVANIYRQGDCILSYW